MEKSPDLALVMLHTLACFLLNLPQHRAQSFLQGI